MPDVGWDAFTVQFHKQSLVPDCVESFLDIKHCYVCLLVSWKPVGIWPVVSMALKILVTTLHAREQEWVMSSGLISSGPEILWGLRNWMAFWTSSPAVVSRRARYSILNWWIAGNQSRMYCGERGHKVVQSRRSIPQGSHLLERVVPLTEITREGSGECSLVFLISLKS